MQANSFDRKEFDDVAAAVTASPLFKEAVAKLNIPEKYEIVVEPWPYGGEFTNSKFFTMNIN